MQIPLSSKENVENVLSYSTAMFKLRLQKTTKNMSKTTGSIVHLRNVRMMQNGREGSYFGDGDEGWKVLHYHWVNNKISVDFSATSGICKLGYVSPYHYPGEKLHTKKPRDDENEKL